ncbi:ATP-binding cassette domain-containing protein [Arsenicitalea aurantiaca]|uniref:ATP-binding cassette domain-containing protein n=2 Tax=Arsenicitalea aurantiaca TaxID=1783274 RepID=A0A433X2S3_9HYPH|nr:ATP-binding cassette domain-containing protein [Arsenicitalea aurantiaca]
MGSSESQRGGLGRSSPDEGGELVDADVERVAGAERHAPVGGLLGGGVDRAGGGRAQHALHRCAVEDLDLEGVTGGELRIDGTLINRLPPKDRDIAMVFQSYALYPHMNVGDNLRFTLKLAQTPKAEIESAIARAAEILGLSDLMERYPRELSGGQRQRVAMGRALVREPKVFLFDEPLSNLDAKLRVQMRAEIKSLHQRLATTTIYVTHDQVEAMTMADKIVVMRDGRVEQMGSPLELYDEPDNIFVAGFIGSPAMNFLEGRCVDRQFVTTGGTSLPAPFSSAEARTYGVRPEHIMLSETGLPARIVMLEPTGSETVATLELGSHLVNALFRERMPQKVGDAITVSIAPDRVALFNEDGNRIRNHDMHVAMAGLSDRLAVQETHL